MEHTNRLIYLEDDDVATVDATGSMITVHYKTHHTVYTVLGITEVCTLSQKILTRN